MNEILSELQQIRKELQALNNSKEPAEIKTQVKRMNGKVKRVPIDN